MQRETEQRGQRETAKGPTPVLELSNLTKSYGSKPVVNKMSMRVEQGEIFGIIGANGAGKTTSVECAQGLRRPDSGSARVLGLDPIQDRAKLRGRVGSQLQDSNLPDRLRVGEAIRLFAADAERAKSAINDWDLGPLRKTAFADLSGGQRQRLFLALALLNRPEVVFLDELTQGLDPTARQAVWRLIERIRDKGTTVVLVTHFMREAEVLCDRVVVMTGGQIVAQGRPADLIERYGQSVRVRFPGTVDDNVWLKSVTDVHKVGLRGGEIEVEGPSTMVAYLGAAVVANNRDPITLRVSQPNLEDALAALIEPNGQDA